MSKQLPFHSTRLRDPQYFHDNSQCSEGKGIKAEYRKAGTGARRLCTECAKLNALQSEVDSGHQMQPNAWKNLFVHSKA